MTKESKEAAMGEQQGSADRAEELTPTAVLTPEMVSELRRRAERRDRKAWEASVVPVEALYALCDAAEALERHKDVTYTVWHWLQAGACRANEPVALERVRQAVQAAIAADAPGRPGEGEGDEDAK